MKRTIIILVVLAAVTMSTFPASADTDTYSLARDAMITYSGNDAFTKLTSMEREACVNWLVHGGEMNEKCSKAVMKLVSYAPNAVTAEQRQALIAEASGNNVANTTQPQLPTEEPPQIIQKKEDNTGKYIAIGLLGVLAGLVIHNNVGHHKSAPSYAPEPQRPAPQGRNNPPQANRPPQLQPQQRPQSRPVSRQQDKRPPHR